MTEWSADKSLRNTVSKETIQWSLLEKGDHHGKFFERTALEETVKNIPKKDLLIIHGDWNAKFRPDAFELWIVQWCAFRLTQPIGVLLVPEVSQTDRETLGVKGVGRDTRPITGVLIFSV